MLYKVGCAMIAASLQGVKTAQVLDSMVGRSLGVYVKSEARLAVFPAVFSCRSRSRLESDTGEKL